MMFWPSFIGGCGLGAVAMIFLIVLLQAFIERGTPPDTADYDGSGEP